MLVETSISPSLSESPNLSPEASEKCLIFTMLLADEVHKSHLNPSPLSFITGFYQGANPPTPPKVPWLLLAS